MIITNIKKDNKQYLTKHGIQCKYNTLNNECNFSFAFFSVFFFHSEKTYAQKRPLYKDAHAQNTVKVKIMHVTPCQTPLMHLYNYIAYKIL